MDIFFVLSGFLISFVLFKEYKKHGDLDIKHYLIGRFWRIWPVMFAVLVYWLPVDWINYNLMFMLIPCSMFIGNLVGETFHLWSIMVEFQFYIISPFIVEYLLLSKTPWRVPIAMILFSTFLNFYITYREMEGDLEDPFFWENNFQLMITKYNKEVYMKTYCRMTPYLAGMYAALVHHKDDGTFHERQSVLVEWLAFVVLIAIGCSKLMPFSFEGWSGVPNYIYFNTSRQTYGLCLAYLITMIVTAKDEVSRLRPSGFLKAFLSWSFWLPWAVISYSFYCWSIPLTYGHDYFGLKPDIPKG